MALHENLGKVMKLGPSNPDPVFQTKSLVLHLRQGVDNTIDKKNNIIPNQVISLKLPIMTLTVIDIPSPSVFSL